MVAARIAAGQAGEAPQRATSKRPRPNAGGCGTVPRHDRDDVLCRGDINPGAVRMAEAERDGNHRRAVNVRTSKPR